MIWDINKIQDCSSSKRKRSLSYLFNSTRYYIRTFYNQSVIIGNQKIFIYDTDISLQCIRKLVDDKYIIYVDSKLNGSFKYIISKYLMYDELKIIDNLENYFKPKFKFKSVLDKKEFLNQINYNRL